MSRIKQQFDLKGKVAIVTGASKGIGESIVRGLAEFGAKVVVSSRKQAAVDEVAAALKADGFDAIGVECHVGDPAQLQNLVDQTVKAYGGVDILINNAATNPAYGPLTALDSDAFDQIMNINVKACHILANLCHPIMKSRGGGSVINIASVGGYKAGIGLAIYSVSKAALIMLSQSQAKEWGADNIRVNAISPGLIKTKFSKALWSDEKNLGFIERALPLGRIAQPDEMAGLACFLASDAASYCTGQSYVNDGGYLIAG